MKKTNKEHHDYILSIQLGIIALILFAVSLQNPLLNEIDNTNNFIYDKETNIIDLDSMTLKQKISQMLKEKNIKHNVLNAKHHEKEAKIISEAGKLEAITIATNMAGRGTDIQLGGNLSNLENIENITKID